MRFVNMSARPAYTKMSGHLLPGQTSSDGGPFRGNLEKALSEVVNACGERLSIILNEREAKLLERLVDLDEKGTGFKRDSLPKEALDDPIGTKEAEKRIEDSQKKHIEDIIRTNEDHARIESEINGESVKKPSVKAHEAPSGEKVEPEMLKSGFDKIMEENAKIESSKPKFDQNVALDPIGANAKKGVERNGDDGDKRADDDGLEVGDAEDKIAEEGIAAKAETNEPSAMPADERNAMDKKAAETAESLSVLSVFSKKPAKGKGRGKKAK